MSTICSQEDFHEKKSQQQQNLDSDLKGAQIVKFRHEQFQGDFIHLIFVFDIFASLNNARPCKRAMF